MSSNEFQPVRIEETFKGKYYLIIAICVIFLFFLSLISVFSAPQMSLQDAILINSLIWPIGIIFVFVILYQTRSFLRPRYFEITDDYVLFDIPNKSKFKRMWSSFDDIEIQQERKYMGRSMKTFYKLLFTGRGITEDVIFQKGRDYSSGTIKTIIESLEESAAFKKKNVLK